MRPPCQDRGRARFSIPTGGSRHVAAALSAVLLTGCSVLHVPSLHPVATKATGTVLVDLPPGIREGAHLAFDDLRSGRLHIDLLGNQLVAVDLPNTVDGIPDPGFAAQQLRSRVNGPAAVLGLIGPRDLRSAEREMPIASNAQLLTLSPNLIDDCLTQPLATCPRGEPNSLYPRGSVDGNRGGAFFFRVPPPMSSEGPVEADYAYSTLNRHSAVVVADASINGRLRGDAIGRRFTNDGGTVLGAVSLVSGGSVEAAAAKVSSLSPDVVFLAGTDPAMMGQLRQALGSLAAPVIGGSELLNGDAYLRAAGASAEGTIAPSEEPDALYSRADIAARLLQAYPSAAPVRGYAIDAYYAAVEVISATSLATVANAQGQAYSVLPAPGDVLTAFIGGGVAPVGVPVDAGERLGTVEFDMTGDDLDKVLAVHVVAHGTWTFKDQVSASG